MEDVRRSDTHRVGGVYYHAGFDQSKLVSVNDPYDEHAAISRAEMREWFGDKPLPVDAAVLVDLAETEGWPNHRLRRQLRERAGLPPVPDVVQRERNKAVRDMNVLMTIGLSFAVVMGAITLLN